MTTQALPFSRPTDLTDASVRKARRGLAIYFPVLIVASGIVEWLIIRNGDRIQNHLGLAFLLMWMPALVDEPRIPNRQPAARVEHSGYGWMGNGWATTRLGGRI